MKCILIIVLSLFFMQNKLEVGYIWESRLLEEECSFISMYCTVFMYCYVFRFSGGRRWWNSNGGGSSGTINTKSPQE